MAGNEMETDYLIVGAGAMGMAFADVVFAEQPKARITLVDRRARPGGHWVDAYPFVRLHQPAAMYGVNSAQLGQGGEDLASGTEILAYYDRLMQRFLASGRVQFLPMSEYQEGGQQGEHRVCSRVNHEQITHIKVHKRVVDGSYMKVQVPATHPPAYSVDEDAALIPINGLAQLQKPWQRYVIVGGGKTGMDAILFLLARGVAPDRIQWIVPNDAWLWDRASVQPGIATAEFLRELDGVIESSNVDELFLTLERKAGICRIDPNHLQEEWRCATIDKKELAALRTVKNVVRMGRVEHIGADEIVLQQGKFVTDRNTLHVDCTANGLAKLPAKPLFEAGNVTLQSVFMCQQVFSAAIIGHLEMLELDDAERNSVFQVIAHPEYKQDMPGCLTISFQNLLNANRTMPIWLRRSRLNLMHHDSLWRYLVGKARRRLSKALESGPVIFLRHGFIAPIKRTVCIAYKIDMFN